MTSKELITKESSLDSILFISSDVLEYKCLICNKIPSPINVTETPCCGGIFCYNCLREWLNSSHECPSCKNDLNLPDKSIIIGKFFNKFEVKCPYHCEFTGKWEDLEKHFKECKNVVKKCKYSEKIGCEFCGNGKDLLDHENNIKIHLDKAVQYTNNISTKKIQFDLDETYRVSTHNHPLSFVESSSWRCDMGEGRIGCLSRNRHFDYPVRFRCRRCDYDLCTYCMMKYVII